MANTEKHRQQKGWIIGIVLILLLLAAIALGGMAVWKAAKAPKTPPKEEKPPIVQAPPVEEPTPEPQPQPEFEPIPIPTEDFVLTPPEEPEPEPEPQPTQVTLMALGDNLIHNSVYWSMELPDGGYDFTSIYQDIAPTVAQYDIACINQETALVADRTMIDNYPTFGTPQEAGDALAAAGFDVITQATNHVCDKDEKGVTNSVAFWRDKYPEITLLGIHDSQEDADAIRVIEKNGIRIAMLNYTYGLNSGVSQKYMVDTLDTFDNVAIDLKKATEQSDFLIVFAHWGKEDYTAPSDYQKNWAQFFADQGVDLVIGHHPHALQPLETVTGAGGNEMPVFYSLGNFFSHQMQPLNMLGGMASITIEKAVDGAVTLTQCELIPTMNVIIRRDSDGWFDYRPMLFENYTDEIAATHRLPGCSRPEMEAILKSILGES